MLLNGLNQARHIHSLRRLLYLAQNLQPLLHHTPLEYPPSFLFFFNFIRACSNIDVMHSVVAELEAEGNGDAWAAGSGTAGSADSTGKKAKKEKKGASLARQSAHVTAGPDLSNCL